MQSTVPTICTPVSPPAINCALLRSLRIVNFRTRVAFNGDNQKKRRSLSISRRWSRRLHLHQNFISSTTAAAGGGGGGSVSELNGDVRKLLQVILWIAEAVYIVWLFLLPYAPGDPVWAISSDTINSVIGLSLNFFFILPLTNFVGIHLMEAPVLHPMSEGLFNFVVAWTLMFAPLLYTDKLRDRFKGSIDVLWGFQMFLTNTFLIPYMALRLNEAEEEYTPRETSQLGSLMTNGASIVGLIGGLVSLLSIVWAFYGRGDGNFGDLGERWEFLLSYLGSERLAYAFIWDICLYLVFQPWLIGDNLQNIRQDKIDSVNLLRFVPVVGLVAYCLCLDSGKET
ncbi:uncharacterized protein LOC130986348 [Salvia miltiorrhiza]|uniref:uncharacterized protein LOC130986348 n=1 Tax=Salvia miltiorrhiza TaxID=226208 RepID=UPI0025AB7466|nr:uncharacterized protein LOC130986348 [Salvia miltiorrhiza]